MDVAAWPWHPQNLPDHQLAGLVAGGPEQERPAWMRITLSELVSNKVLDCGAGTCHIGDGRGYDKAFRLGETEDYLVRSYSDQPGEGADPSVRKEGRLSPERDPSTGNVFWLAQWSVRYKNAGHGLATNVVVTDQLSGPQTLDGQRSAPVIAPIISGNSLTYNVGNLGRAPRATSVCAVVCPSTHRPAQSSPIR